MHGDWDLVKLDLPGHVFAKEHIAVKGQHYIVHFSSRSSTDATYTDAIDVNVLMEDIDPDLIYGSTSGKWYGARFPAEIYTRECHWIPHLFT